MNKITTRATEDVNFIGEHGTVRQVRRANEYLRAMKRPMESIARITWYANVIAEIRAECEK